MNRWDEIKATALDVAQHVTQDPIKRDRMANDLITLIGRMLDAAGKGVAIEGEAELSRVRGWIRPTNETPEEAAEFDDEQDRESNKAHNRYLLGESLQREADRVMSESRTADLSRYDKPAWRPSCVGCGERDGHAVGCDAAGASVETLDECNGICLYAADIGVPEAGHVVAYAHPDCEVHGDSSDR